MQLQKNLTTHFKKDIYLDSAATTEMDPLVQDLLSSLYRKKIGNSSSLHRRGVESATWLEKARSGLANRIGCEAQEIYFTSGGTESNNLILAGVMKSCDPKSHLIVSSIEHSSVLQPAYALQKEGFALTVLPVDSEGKLNLDALKSAFRSDTKLVSVMHANNEIGTIQNLSEISAICRGRNVLFHSDACQSLGKVNIDVCSLGIDLLSFSGHKIHGPKGVGGVFVKKGVAITPLFFGGGQELGLRSGTVNVESIVAMAEALELMKPSDIRKMTNLRDHFETELVKNIDGVRINGPASDRLCNILNISIDGIDGKKLLFALSQKGIFISNASACASGKKAPSHVLLALGQSVERASQSLRLSLNKWTTENDIEETLKKITECIHHQRKLNKNVS